MKKTKPSDFCNQPYASVMNKSEHKTIAANIMLILKRTGNKFRVLSKDEYIKERKKDGHFSMGEMGFFREVISYCTSAKMAKLFSPTWAKE